MNLWKLSQSWWRKNFFADWATFCNRKNVNNNDDNWREVSDSKNIEITKQSVLEGKSLKNERNVNKENLIQLEFIDVTIQKSLLSRNKIFLTISDFIYPSSNYLVISCELEKFNFRKNFRFHERYLNFIQQWESHEFQEKSNLIRICFKCNFFGYPQNWRYHPIIWMNSKIAHKILIKEIKFQSIQYPTHLTFHSYRYWSHRFHLTSLAGKTNSQFPRVLVASFPDHLYIASWQFQYINHAAIRLTICLTSASLELMVLWMKAKDGWKLSILLLLLCRLNFELNFLPFKG